MINELQTKDKQHGKLAFKLSTVTLKLTKNYDKIKQFTEIWSKIRQRGLYHRTKVTYRSMVILQYGQSISLAIIIYPHSAKEKAKLKK